MSQPRWTATYENESRALRAEDALFGYDDDTETRITDLLSDLRHLCGREGLCFDTINARAANHFHAETEN